MPDHPPLTAKEYDDRLRDELADELAELDPGRHEPEMTYASRLAGVAAAALTEAQAPLDRADPEYRAVDGPLLRAKTAALDLDLQGQKLSGGEPEASADARAAADGAAGTARTALVAGTAEYERLTGSVEQAAGRIVVAAEALSRLRQHVQERGLLARLAAELHPDDQDARLGDVAESVTEARRELTAAGAHLRNGRQELDRLSAAVDAVAPGQDAAATLSRAGVDLETRAQGIRSRLATDRDLVWQAAGTAGSARRKAGELETAFRSTAEAEQTGAEISERLAEVDRLTRQGREAARTLRPDTPGYAQGLARLDHDLALCEQKLEAGRETLERLDRMPADPQAKADLRARLQEQQQVVTAARGAIGPALAGAKDPEIERARRGINPPAGPRAPEQPDAGTGQVTEAAPRRRAPATVDHRPRETS